ncbi:MAG: winged helix-turn-helix domain-containing protein [Methanobacteriota archaeon]
MVPVNDPEEIARICAALGHPNRAFLYQLLQENEPVSLADLTRLAQKSATDETDFNYMTVKFHVQKLVEHEVARLVDRGGQVYVKLLLPNIRIVTGEAAPEARNSAKVL